MRYTLQWHERPGILLFEVLVSSLNADDLHDINHEIIKALDECPFEAVYYIANRHQGIPQKYHCRFRSPALPQPSKAERHCARRQPEPASHGVWQGADAPPHLPHSRHNRRCAEADPSASEKWRSLNKLAICPKACAWRRLFVLTARPVVFPANSAKLLNISHTARICR